MMKDKIKHVMSELSLEEKVALCSGEDFWHLKGIERLGLPKIMVTDGPHGLRKQDADADHLGMFGSVPSTCFPTAVGLASSWDNELVYNLGEKLAEECITEKVSVLLGPGANIKRHPLCGRNFEYFSEDPFLSGKLSASLIKGIQSKGIGTSMKHFVANNQETMRMGIDALVDERTLREIYLKGFEIAVKEAQPWTVMCSYNKLNGTYLSENKKILDDILKKEWGHNGLVMTDWGACNNRVNGLIAGQELEMPGSNGIHDQKVIKAIKEGTLSEKVLDERVSRVVELILKSKETLDKDNSQFDKEEHHAFARKVAADTIVLLQNKDNILPLNKNQTVALIGEFAKIPRYQGSGSSLINPIKLSKAYDAFKEVLGDKLLYAPGYNIKNDVVEDFLVSEAIKIAKKADVVVLMVGLTDLFESEGFDRTHLNIPNNHLHLINEIADVNKNIIIALSNGSPIVMPWKDNVKGIIEQYLGGQASGEALCDIVFGKVNPSGKLAETFPNSLTEFPSNQNFPGLPRQEEYREGLYVGYRYYDSVTTEPLFPFGYGLSYTTFEYSDLVVSKDKNIEVSFIIKNKGKIEGKEIAQVYISLNDSVVYRPEKELKGYRKVSLKAGESKTVKLVIPLTSLEIYNVDGFKLENGKYTVKVGKSSKEIVLKETINVKSSSMVIADNLNTYKNINDSFEPSKADFEILYGREVPAYPNIKPYNINSVFNELKGTLIGKMLHKTITKQFVGMIGEGETNEAILKMMESMVDEMPFRSMVTFSNGAISENRALGLLDLMNKRIFKGIWKIIRG